MTEPATAATELAQLRERAANCAARVSEVEAQQRLAVEAHRHASETLVAFERKGEGTAADRKRLEQALATAKAEAEAPWAERIEGARHRARDADQAVRVCAAENLGELVVVEEGNGAIVASRMNALAEEMVATYGEWQTIAGRISALVGQAGGIRPGDVSSSSADALVREAQRLIQNGGEEGPTLRRDRFPALRPVVEQAVA